jgi:hypothetical protein
MYPGLYLNKTLFSNICIELSDTMLRTLEILTHKLGAVAHLQS